MTAAIEITRPEAGEYNPYFDTYLKLVGDEDILQSLDKQIAEMHELLDNVSDEEASKLHEPYTWTIKQVMGHLIDNESVFSYRARCFSSGESASLPGYDQDVYVANTNYENVSLDSLIAEFENLRRAFLLMCKRWMSEQWKCSGSADGKPISVRAIAYLQVGHVRHHLAIVAKRLGKRF